MRRYKSPSDRELIDKWSWHMIIINFYFLLLGIFFAASKAKRLNPFLSLALLKHIVINVQTKPSIFLSVFNPFPFHLQKHRKKNVNVAFY